MQTKKLMGAVALGLLLATTTSIVTPSVVKAETVKSDSKITKEKVSEQKASETKEKTKQVKADLFSGGDGTTQAPFKISTKQDLIDLAQYSAGRKQDVTYSQEYFNNAYYEQLNDIDMEYGFNFIPIGYSTENGFSGTYDAKENTISNLMNDFARGRSTIQESVGLFARTENATIKNVKLENPEITTTGQAHDNVGAIVGYASKSHITNCSVVGGFISAPTSNNIGGIVGFNNASEITDSRSETTITGNNNVGGVFGQSTGTLNVYDNYSKSDVSGVTNVGGIGGYIVTVPTNSTLTNNYTSGSITGTTNVGGIIGFLNSGANVIVTIKNNYSYANLKATSNVGGIVGQTAGYDIYIDQNYVYNHIEASTSYAGGIIGYTKTDTSWSSSRQLTHLDNNYIITHITAPSSVTNVSVIGMGFYVEGSSNNHYSFDCSINGGTVGSFANAKVTYQPEINLFSWWDTVLLINKDNAFNTKRLNEGYLPTLYKKGSATEEVRDQKMQEYAGNHLPEATDGKYEIGINEPLEIEINAYGSVVTGVQGLTENTDYYTDGSNLILKPEFLDTLGEGTKRFVVEFNSGYKINVYVEIKQAPPKHPFFENETINFSGTQFDDAIIRFSYGETSELGIDLTKTTIENITTGYQLVNNPTSGDFMIRQSSLDWYNITFFGTYLSKLTKGETYIFRITFDNKSYEDITVNIQW